MRKRLPKRSAWFYIKIALISTIVFAGLMVLLLELGVSQYKIAGYAKCYPVFFLIWVFAEHNYQRYKNIY